jgi:hypothetical protein
MREHRIALEHDAAIGAAFGAHRLAVEQNLATARRFLAEDQAEEGALAGTRGADHRDEAALGDLKRDAFEHDLVAVFDPDVAHFEQRTHRPAPCAQGKPRRLTNSSSASVAIASSEIQATYGRMMSIAK